VPVGALGFNPRWRNKKWKLKNKGRNEGKLKVSPFFKSILEERINFAQVSKKKKKNPFKSNKGKGVKKSKNIKKRRAILKVLKKAPSFVFKTS
jgi:hypothetical protein